MSATFSDFENVKDYLRGNRAINCNIIKQEKSSLEVKILIKEYIAKKGFEVFGNEPLKITVRANGERLSKKFRELGGECEYSDEQFIVFMATTENSDKDWGQCFL